MALRSVLAAAQAVAGLVVLGRLAQGRRRRPPLAAGDAVPAELAPTISAVVPARDEAARIGPCLAGLLADPDLVEVIVVDDGSADDTAGRARAAGAEVVVGTPLPDGWTGKAWALHQGIGAARGDLVLHVDADTRPRPGLARAMAAALAQGDEDVLSAGPAFRCQTAADLVVHPAFLATLPYRFGVADADGRRPRPSRTMLNGQCVLLPRERFMAAGGYARVRGNMTEDLALARSLASDGWRVGFVDGAALLEIEMYGSARETVREWGRSIAGADVTGATTLAADVATLWLTMALPVMRLLARRPLSGVDCVLLAVRALLGVQLAGRYRPRSPLALLAPLADPLVAARITLAAARPARSWRGRRYGARGRAAR